MSRKNPIAVLSKMEQHRKTAHLKDVSESDPKLLRAKLILEREQMKAKNSRLECLLIQQFIKKYGSKNPTSRLNGIIKTFVHEYVTSSEEEISPAAVDTLERSVKDMTNDAKDEMITAKQDSMRTRSAEDRKNTKQIVESSGPGYPNSAGGHMDLNQWSVVNTMLALKDKEQNELALRKSLEKKIKFKNALDEQLEAQQFKKVVAVETKKKELAMANADVEDFKHGEMDKSMAITSKVQCQRDLQMQQIEDNKKRIAREREMKITQEKRDMERSRLLAEDEQRRVLEKKEWTKMNNEKMKEENERSKQIKANAKREQDEYEIRLNHEYEAKLAKEEQDRANAFATRMSKLIQSAKKFETTTGAQIQQESDRNTQKVMAEIKAKQDADEAREKAKRDKRALENKYSTEFNLDQANRKMLEKTRLQQEAQAIQRQFEADAVKHRREEEAKKTVRLAQREELKGYLDHQVLVQRSKVRNEQALTDEEKMLNRTLIEKIEKDPELYNKVTSALHPLGTAASHTTFSW